MITITVDTAGEKPMCLDPSAFVKDFLRNTVSMLDEKFGDGYAQANPQLVAECIQAQAEIWRSITISAASQDIVRQLSDLVSALYDLKKEFSDVTSAIYDVAAAVETGNEHD